nr:MAG: hypothetical protein J07AB56_04900 [Candidatus Nanosalinarum sp. J07AB56]
MKPDELEEGDRVLFGDRKVPLEVDEAGEDRVLVNGPQGGEYVLYTEDDTVLVSSKGDRRYSSLADDLRTTGRWSREGDKWTHTKTGEKVCLERTEAGFWRIETGFSIDQPMYGYRSKEDAETEAKNLLESHPEGV